MYETEESEKTGQFEPKCLVCESPPLDFSSFPRLPHPPALDKKMNDVKTCVNSIGG